MAEAAPRVADECRGSSLDESLLAVQRLTSAPQSAAELLLLRMNEVLRAASEAEEEASCSAAMAALHESIDRVQQWMVAHCEDLPLLYFARSFAVVFEKALQHPRKFSESPATVPHLPSADNNGKQLLQLKESEEEREEWRNCEAGAASAAIPTASSGAPAAVPLNLPCAIPAEAEEAREEKAIGQPATTVPGCLQYAIPAQGNISSDEKEKTEERRSTMTVAAAAATTPAAAATAAPSAVAPRLVGCENWRREIQRRFPNKELDFTLEAVEGRIAIYNVARCVREEEARELLRPFGPLVDFFYNNFSRKGAGFVLAKFQSNRAADEAVARLNGTLLGGTRILLKRAEYWSKPGRPQRKQQPQQPDKLQKLQQMQTLQQTQKLSESQATVPHLPPAENYGKQLLQLKESEEKLDSWDSWNVCMEKREERRNCEARAAPPSMSTAASDAPDAAKAVAMAVANADASAATKTELAASKFAPLVGSEQWRREIQRSRPDKILDFSMEAIEGRIIINNVPASVRGDEVRALLQPFGPIVEFYYSDYGKKTDYVLAKLQVLWCVVRLIFFLGRHFQNFVFWTNRAADEAVVRLKNARLGGAVIFVKRALYWARYCDEHKHQRQLHQSQSRPDYSKQTVVHQPVAPAAAACVDYDIPPTVLRYGVWRL